MSVDNLVMTDEEICRSFDEAKNKKNQITVLADLNVCKKSQIARILYKYRKITEGTLNSYINSRGRAKNAETERGTTEDGSVVQMPPAVEELVKERISALESVISKTLKEKDELVTFLEKAGESDGIQ